MKTCRASGSSSLARDSFILILYGLPLITFTTGPCSPGTRKRREYVPERITKQNALQFSGTKKCRDIPAQRNTFMHTHKTTREAHSKREGEEQTQCGFRQMFFKDLEFTYISNYKLHHLQTKKRFAF